MNLEELKEHNNTLEAQLRSLEATHLKVQGAIELCQKLIAEQEEPKKEEKKKDK